MPSTTFTAAQLNIIKGFLEEFRDAPKRDKAAVVKRASVAIIEKTATNKKDDKGKRKEIRKVGAPDG